jgi:hypothetical protein
VLSYTIGSELDDPVSDFSSLSQGDTQVSVRPSGTDDAFLFRYKLP